MLENEVLTLRQWRNLKGLSQKKLADETGLTERTISNYEKSLDNLNNASYKNIKVISDALGVKVDQIFLDDTSEKPKQEVR